VERKVVQRSWTIYQYYYFYISFIYILNIIKGHLLFVIGLKIYSKETYKQSLDSNKRYY